MKKITNKQKNYLLTLLSLILICLILLTINNKIIQSIGIILTPFIVVSVILLMKMENKKEEN
ncbi:MAG: hypothetical protein IKL65_01180 [Bacilli bacterium]|nr:hypothetical protein [Bacilli bacterium]